jgi:hypothetical protein
MEPYFGSVDPRGPDTYKSSSDEYFKEAGRRPLLCFSKGSPKQDSGTYGRPYIPMVCIFYSLRNNGRTKLHLLDQRVG